jgi:hypothetical protein
MSNLSGRDIAPPATADGGEGQRPWGAAVVVLAVMLAYAAVAALQILVWNPLAAVPGMNLAGIRAAMAHANEPLRIAPVIAILGLGVVLTAALLAWMLKARVGPRQVVVVGLALVAWGAPAYFVASFNAGMSMADAFGIGGGDYAPWGGVLMQFSLGALLALCIVVLGGAITRAARWASRRR